MNAKDPNEIVAVKCAGPFTEWYSPNYREPYEDNADFRDYYNREIINEQPVTGPSLGDSEDDFISDDLQCLAERICCDSSDWDVSTEDFKATVEMCLQDGKPRLWEDTKSDEKIQITPYRRGEMPPVNEASLAVYGPYADLLRERVESI